MAEGNEKQAGQKKGAELRTLIAQLLGVVELAECENCETAYGDDDPERCAECEGVYVAVLDAREAMKDPPPPHSAEKLALRGEPTARTLIANLLLAMDDKLPCLQLVEVFAAARAYLSTRAPAEEAALAALRAWHAAKEGTTRDLMKAEVRLDEAGLALAALPVEGRAPDASHEKQLGKKGGG